MCCHLTKEIREITYLRLHFRHLQPLELALHVMLSFLLFCLKPSSQPVCMCMELTIIVVVRGKLTVHYHYEHGYNCWL